MRYPLVMPTEVVISASLLRVVVDPRQWGGSIDQNLGSPFVNRAAIVNFLHLQGFHFSIGKMGLIRGEVVRVPRDDARQGYHHIKDTRILYKSQ